jgi:putative phosphoribosyl transferase
MAVMQGERAPRFTWKDPAGRRSDVTIEAEGVALPGELLVPSSPSGVVVFAHGSGSSHLSPRNAQVARVLNREGLATLLFDLLTGAEAVDRANVFDVPLLARRLDSAHRWLRAQPETGALPAGFFGASTGAAAALWAATESGADVRAIVSRGGRPDLAGPRLGLVHAPTLLIVGGADELVLELNRRALAGLGSGGHELAVVPGATHLFEEPGTLEQVAELARRWFVRHLG